MHREVNFILSGFVLIRGSEKLNVKEQPSLSLFLLKPTPFLLPLPHSHLKNKCN